MAHRQLMDGLFVNFDQCDRFGHSFGGSHSTQGAWCPNCDKPLMLHLTLDLRDLRLRFRDVNRTSPRLQLFYCMRCALSWYDFSYQVIDQDSIRIIEAYRGPLQTDDWIEGGAGVDEFRSRPIALSPIPARLQQLWDRLNSLRRDEELTREEFADLKALTAGYAFPVAASFTSDYYFVNQVGGRPLLCQGIDDPDCPKCGEGHSRSDRMYFLACLYNDAQNRLRVAYECTQVIFFLCPVCFTVKVVHRCT